MRAVRFSNPLVTDMFSGNQVEEQEEEEGQHWLAAAADRARFQRKIDIIYTPLLGKTLLFRSQHTHCPRDNHFSCLQMWLGGGGEWEEEEEELDEEERNKEEREEENQVVGETCDSEIWYGDILADDEYKILGVLDEDTSLQQSRTMGGLDASVFIYFYRHNRRLAMDTLYCEKMTSTQQSFNVKKYHEVIVKFSTEHTYCSSDEGSDASEEEDGKDTARSDYHEKVKRVKEEVANFHQNAIRLDAAVNVYFYKNNARVAQATLDCYKMSSTRDVFDVREYDRILVKFHTGYDCCTSEEDEEPDEPSTDSDASYVDSD